MCLVLEADRRLALKGCAAARLGPAMAASNAKTSSQGAFLAASTGVHRGRARIPRRPRELQSGARRRGAPPPSGTSERNVPAGAPLTWLMPTSCMFISATSCHEARGDVEAASMPKPRPQASNPCFRSIWKLQNTVTAHATRGSGPDQGGESCASCWAVLEAPDLAHNRLVAYMMLSRAAHHTLCRLSSCRPQSARCTARAVRLARRRAGDRHPTDPPAHCHSLLPVGRQ